MNTLPDGLRQSARHVGLVVRAVLLVVCASLSAAQGTLEDLLWMATIVPMAMAVVYLDSGRTGKILLLAAESALCAVAVVSVGPTSAFLPYLIAPALSGALTLGISGALVPPGAAAFTLLLGRAVHPDRTPLREYAPDVALWVVLAGLTGLVAAWLVRVLQSGEQQDPRAAQRAAYELLNQLRVVARRLPGTLDPAATAESLLQGAHSVAPFDAGAVLVRGAGTRLVPLALAGSGQPEWDLSLSGNGSVADAWLTQQPQVRERGLLRADGGTPDGSSLVVPLSVGVRTIGLLVLESARGRTWPSETVRDIAAKAEVDAISLETGLLFDEVRAMATAEERNRVARAIHDGIAQELVFLGYELDNLLVEADRPVGDVAPRLRGLREEVTRLISELRLSLFDLRGDVDVHAGLGTALGEHLRSVGTQTGLTVHLSLSESSLRLPPNVEVELLRIAQEAVANVRKHAHAQNLWVTCAVDPPDAALSIEDDGIGWDGKDRDSRYGLGIMRERAERLHAEFAVGRSTAGGTSISVRLSRRPAVRAS